jgi:serine/threonine-protein kinase
MAPEQARGKWEHVDERTDLWAVGATMFTLLTGKHVHEGDTVNETLALAVTNPARSLAEQRPDLHPALVSLVDRALRYNKTERFPDAATMQEELRRTYVAIQGEDVSLAPQLSIPDRSGEAPAVVVTPATPSQLEKVDRSRQLTTAGGVTASGQSMQRRSFFARQRLTIGAAVVTAVILTLVILALRAPEPKASGTIDSAMVPLAAAASGVVVPDQGPPKARPAPVAIDDLPKEVTVAASAAPSGNPRAAPRPTGVKRQAPVKDPFARRR